MWPTSSYRLAMRNLAVAPVQKRRAGTVAAPYMACVRAVVMQVGYLIFATTPTHGISVNK
jgi:hypothetical protein